ncbi:MAG: hypothetical protein QOF90_1715, partial [Acetobacteraceae bacterium]|nr:hypothetical protein [Acetobacteraceae bacterium]
LYVKPLDTVGDQVMRTVGTLGIERAVLDRIPASLLRLQQESAPSRAIANDRA